MSVDLDVVEAKTDWIKSKHRAAWRAKPRVRIYHNPPSGEADRGLIYRGSIGECSDAKIAFTRREVTEGTISLRKDHYIAKWITSLPYTREAKKNVVVIIDHMGKTLRWSGLLHDWKVKKDGNGLWVLNLTFVDDRQYLQTLFAPPNPALPIPIVQFPRVLPVYAPTLWGASMFILWNLMRYNGNWWNLPSDPFDWSSWTDSFDMSTWQAYVVAPSFLDDSSTWGLFSTRMDDVESVIAENLDMAEISVEYRRILTDDGEDPADYGLDYVDDVRNGALVLKLVDHSGYATPDGTAFSFGPAVGFQRSVVEFANGFVEEYVSDAVFDDTEIWPDEYYQENTWLEGWLPVRSRPWVIIRDSKWSSMETAEIGYQLAGPAAAIVGGDNPYVDQIMDLTIRAVGNILGYFALGGFSSAGDLAAAAVMPFLRGTLFAWLYHKNVVRSSQSGWVHLPEMRGGGGDQNAWSLSSIAALTGAFSNTKAQSTHQFSLGSVTRHYPGIHFVPGQRMASTADSVIPGFVHVDCVETIELSFGLAKPNEYKVAVGTGQVGESAGDRFAKLFDKTLTTISELGVRIVS